MRTEPGGLRTEPGGDRGGKISPSRAADMSSDSESDELRSP